MQLNEVFAESREILHRLVVYVNTRRSAINAYIIQRRRKEFNHKSVCSSKNLIKVNTYSARVFILSILSHRELVSVLVQGMRSL